LHNVTFWGPAKQNIPLFSIPLFVFACQEVGIVFTEAYPPTPGKKNPRPAPASNIDYTVYWKNRMQIYVKNVSVKKINKKTFS
jgi:hypothetical protein